METLVHAAKERGWRLLEVFEESVKAGPGLDRPELQRALTLLADGDTHALVVSSMDRLVLSLRDLAVLIRWFEAAAGPKLVSVKPGIVSIDTTSEQGRGFASAVAYFGEWEGVAASFRVQEALLARRASGRRISRPAVADDENLSTIVKVLRDRGLTLQQIADVLNAQNVPTLRGGAMWRPSSLQAVLGQPREPAARSPVLPPPRPTASGASKTIA
jgi:DNA invertase Pin-like site-specific DNA recombinase